MSADFDQFPVYDPLIKSGTNAMSDVWVSAMITLFQNLISYLSQNGIFLPNLSTEQRNLITSPQNGQMIYNITDNTGQIYKNGVWTNF
jgi:hypothetical protein